MVDYSNLPSSLRKDSGDEEEKDEIKKSSKNKTKNEKNNKTSYHKPKPKTYPPKRHNYSSSTNSRSLPKFNLSLNMSTLLSIIALVIAIVAFGMVMMDSSSNASSEDLQELASNIKELKNKEVTFDVPITAVLNLDTTVPGNEIFKGKTVVPVEVNIPIDQEVSGIDTRTGVPLQISLNDLITSNGEVIVNLENEDIAVNMDKNITINGTVKQKIKMGNIAGDELDNIADLVIGINN